MKSFYLLLLLSLAYTTTAAESAQAPTPGHNHNEYTALLINHHDIPTEATTTNKKCQRTYLRYGIQICVFSEFSCFQLGLLQTDWRNTERIRTLTVCTRKHSAWHQLCFNVSAAKPYSLALVEYFFASPTHINKKPQEKTQPKWNDSGSTTTRALLKTTK